MSTNDKLLAIAKYLRETPIPNWNFAEVEFCAYAHFPLIFKDFEIEKGHNEGTYLGLNSSDMSYLFHPVWHTSINNWINHRGKLSKTATKEELAAHIEDFVRKQNEKSITKRISKNPAILDEVKDRLENDPIVD